MNMVMCGCFGNNSFKNELISEDIHITQYKESANKKYVLIDAIKPGKCFIIVKTYKLIHMCNHPVLKIPVELFFIKIEVV